MSTSLFKLHTSSLKDTSKPGIAQHTRSCTCNGQCMGAHVQHIQIYTRSWTLFECNHMTTPTCICVFSMVWPPHTLRTTPPSCYLQHATLPRTNPLERDTHHPRHIHLQKPANASPTPFMFSLCFVPHKDAIKRHPLAADPNPNPNMPTAPQHCHVKASNAQINPEPNAGWFNKHACT